MTIDWTKPVIRTIDPDDAPPGRVLCTDQPGDYPVAVWWPDCGSPTSYTFDGRLSRSGNPSVINAPEPKPAPVLREAWMVLEKNGMVLDCYEERLAKGYTDDSTVEVRYLRWMSDGSPVPGVDDVDVYALYERIDDYKAECADWAATTILLTGEKDALQAEVSALQKDLGAAMAKRIIADDTIARLQADDLIWADQCKSLTTQRDAAQEAQAKAWDQVYAMRPVVDAALAYAQKIAYRPEGKFKALVWSAARAYLATHPTIKHIKDTPVQKLRPDYDEHDIETMFNAPADKADKSLRHALNTIVAPGMPKPIKSCGSSCRHYNTPDYVHCGPSGCLTSGLNIPGWEPRQ